MDSIFKNFSFARDPVQLLTRVGRPGKALPGSARSCRDKRGSPQKRLLATAPRTDLYAKCYLIRRPLLVERESGPSDHLWLREIASNEMLHSIPGLNRSFLLTAETPFREPKLGDLGEE
jgi:hypothetical protein